MRKILQIFFRFLFNLLARVEVHGLENIPSQGGAILAINHQGILDAPLVFSLLERQDSTALVAKKHQKNLPLRWVVNNVGGIWLNRDDADAQAIRAAQKYLKAGGLLGIAPEGTRSPDGSLGPGKTGMAYLAEKAGVPVIPIAVYGTSNGLKKALTLRRPRMTVKFGQPIQIPPIQRRSREADLQRATDMIMCQIAVMLPEDRRGAYKDHPCLQELLSQQSELAAAERVH